MNGFPRSSLSTTFVSTRLALGKRRDSSAGLGAPAFRTGTGAEGCDWSLQEASKNAVHNTRERRMVRSIARNLEFQPATGLSFRPKRGYLVLCIAAVFSPPPPAFWRRFKVTPSPAPSPPVPPYPDALPTWWRET